MPESIGDAALGALAISDGGPGGVALMLPFTLGDQALLGGGPAAPAVFIADSSLGSSLTSDISL